MIFPLQGQVSEFFRESSDLTVNKFMMVSEGIFEAKTTNMNRVKDLMGRVRDKPETLPVSHYTYMMRFYELSDVEKKKLIKAVSCLCFYLLGDKVKYLILDGLSWERGEKKNHLLVLSLLVGSVSIPLWWVELDKKGKSSFKERKQLFDEVFSHFDLSGLILLADREYDGMKWFNYLKDNGLDFVIRLKKRAYQFNINQCCGKDAVGDNQQKARYSKLEKLAEFSRYRKCGVRKKFKLGNGEFTFVVLKNPQDDTKEPLLYFLSSLTTKRKIITSYLLRWKIECCFKHIQSNGFNLTQNGFKDPEKIELLMSQVVFLYVLATIEGMIKYKKLKKSDFKKYKDGTIYLAISFFRKGLSIIHNKFFDLISFIEYLNQIKKSKIVVLNL